MWIVLQADYCEKLSRLMCGWMDRLVGGIFPYYCVCVCVWLHFAFFCKERQWPSFPGWSDLSYYSACQDLPVIVPYSNAPPYIHTCPFLDVVQDETTDIWHKVGHPQQSEYLFFFLGQNIVHMAHVLTETNIAFLSFNIAKINFPGGLK